MRSKTDAGRLVERVGAGFLASSLLSGCDPVVNLEGAFFPAWFFCVVAGIGLATVLRVVFARSGIEEHFISVPIVYFCLALSLSLVLWLVLYRT